MASAYGPWVASDDWRSWVGVTITSSSDTQATVQVQGWFGADAGSSTGSGNVRGWVGYKIGSGGITWDPSGTGVAIDPFSSGSSKYYRTKSWTINKTHSAQTVTGYADVEGTAGIYSGSKSQAAASITIPAKTSKTITYNANGGSGAPAAQTKWYGETLVLSSTRPTRTNYNFKGWATSSTATTAAYQPGANYTANPSDNVTLYAVWELAYVAPTLTIAAYRSDASGNRSPESTSNITVEFSWSLNQTGGTNTSGTITINHGTSSADSISISAATGSGKKPYTQTLVATSTLTVSVTIKDAHNLTTTRSVTIGQVFKPFSMTNGGASAAFFGFAGSAWNKILCVFGSFIAEDGNIHADSTNTDSSASSVSTQVDRGFYSRDKNKRTIACFYGRQSTDGKDQAVITARRYNSSANVDNSLILAVDKNGNRTVAVTDRKVWQKAIGGWNQIATTTGTTAKTFSDLSAAGYSEVLVTGTYTPSSGAIYGGSVVIPIQQLSSTERDWYLGGGHWSAGWGAACKLSLTKITPYQIRYNGSNGNGTWTVYAR